MLRHRRRFVANEREQIRDAMPAVEADLPGHTFLEGRARLTVAVERHERPGEVGDRRQELRVEPHRFPKWFDRPIVLAEISALPGGA